MRAARDGQVVPLRESTFPMPSHRDVVGDFEQASTATVHAGAAVAGESRRA